MRKLFFISAVLLLLPILSFAQDAGTSSDNSLEPVNGAQNIQADAFYKAEVFSVPESRYLGPDSDKQLFQTLNVKILDGDEKGKEVTIQNVGGATLNGGNGFKPGDRIVIDKTTANGQTEYFVEDIYRFPSLVIATAIFLAVAVFFSRLKGVTSILGLIISIAVIVKFVAPRVVDGHNPLLTCLIGTFIIAVVSLYLAHGFNKRTSIALLSTLLTLVIAVGLAITFVHFSKLFGNGSEESVYLQIDQSHHIDLQGLLLGAIILGALGVLDDITTAQSAVVDELRKANPSFTFKQLYQSGISVGREHISSLINTLFLAYAGVSLPLFLLLTINSGAPIWTTLNSEFIAEEIIRTLVGSITLIVAVPITTLLAAYFWSRSENKQNTAI
ncbi:MAG TPA: YibE/F family protein [Patescibacteria group bacterium]|nr:YibE/F family protein [Patescibacteria group bacterium]